ncbi:hypothetical protein Ciccas_006361 [Cichlidogyrus casuarinus]|uniref:Uncharacterized protein n=1 Tax=Cichlidogyrus casuarinus TaxID=1844966 RepID=A0ABD2Q604_9PLAT
MARFGARRQRRVRSVESLMLADDTYFRPGMSSYVRVPVGRAFDPMVKAVASEQPKVKVSTSDLFQGDQGDHEQPQQISYKCIAKNKYGSAESEVIDFTGDKLKSLTGRLKIRSEPALKDNKTQPAVTEEFIELGERDLAPLSRYEYRDGDEEQLPEHGGNEWVYQHMLLNLQDDAEYEITDIKACNGHACADSIAPERKILTEMAEWKGEERVFKLKEFEKLKKQLRRLDFSRANETQKETLNLLIDLLMQAMLIFDEINQVWSTTYFGDIDYAKGFIGRIVAFLNEPYKPKFKMLRAKKRLNEQVVITNLEELDRKLQFHKKEPKMKFEAVGRADLKEFIDSYSSELVRSRLEYFYSTNESKQSEENGEVQSMFHPKSECLIDFLFIWFGLLSFSLPYRLD